MVVLAVNVIGNRPAQRDIARARCGRQEPAPRHDEAQNVIQGHAGLGPQHTGIRIELDIMIEACGFDQRAVRIEIAVAIGAPQPDRQPRLAAFLKRRQKRCSGLRRTRSRHIMIRFDHAPPGPFGGLRVEVRRHRKLAAANMATSIAPRPRLILSFTAKLTGSSSSSPRCARSHIRKVQIPIMAGATIRNSGAP